MTLRERGAGCANRLFGALAAAFRACLRRITIRVLQLGVVDAEVVADLVGDGPAHLLDNFLVGAADGATVDVIRSGRAPA
jgi:hypothetical protein